MVMLFPECNKLRCFTVYKFYNFDMSDMIYELSASSSTPSPHHRAQHK